MTNPTQEWRLEYRFSATEEESVDMLLAAGDAMCKGAMPRWLRWTYSLGGWRFHKCPWYVGSVHPMYHPMDDWDIDEELWQYWGSGTEGEIDYFLSDDER